MLLAIKVADFRCESNLVHEHQAERVADALLLHQSTQRAIKVLEDSHLARGQRSYRLCVVHHTAG
jgi:hypothetical protein